MNNKSFIFFLVWPLLGILMSCERDYGDEINYKEIQETKIPIDIEIIAHRGASIEEPENSILAFTRAFELNSEGIELDLWLSQDDSLIVFHDINTIRVTGENFNIPDTNSSILRNLNIGKGEKIPFLSEVLKIVPQGKKIFIDIKWYSHHKSKINPAVIDNFIYQIKKYADIDNVVLICFSSEYLFTIKQKYPEITCLWITRQNNYNEEVYSTIDKYNFEGIVAVYNGIDTQLSLYLIEKKKMLYIYTVNDLNLAVTLYNNFKPKGILTDRPDYIRQGL